MKKNIILFVIVLLVAVLGVYWFSNMQPKNDSRDQIVCTQDTKLCPDGSFVSRTGPDCEFAECVVKDNILSKIPQDFEQCGQAGGTVREFPAYRGGGTKCSWGVRSWENAELFELCKKGGGGIGVAEGYGDACQIIYTKD